MLPQNTPAQIAWIGSFQIFFIFFMSIIVSPLMDKGHFRACCNGGSALLVLSIFATSFCTEWWQLLLVQGILTGIAMGLIFGAGIMVLVSYFSTHIGLATGIAAAGSSVGKYRCLSCLQRQSLMRARRYRLPLDGKSTHLQSRVCVDCQRHVGSLLE